MVHDTPAPAAVTIDVYTHGVTVRNFAHQIKNHLVDFCRFNAQMGLVRVGRNRYEKRMLRIYASTTRTRNEFRFHRNQLKGLLDFLANRGVSASQVRINNVELYEPLKVDLKFTDPRPPRDEQLPLINYLTSPAVEGYAPSKVVTLQTGKGKGFISIKSICDIGYRTLIVVKPMYIRKWVLELKEMTNLKDEDIMVISGESKKYTGKEMLRALLTQAVEDRLDCKVIVLSNVIYSDYLDLYNDQMGEGDFPVEPMDFCKALRVGVRLIDEVHQDFHRNFRFDLFTHVPLTISLSATLESDDKFMNDRYRIVWPTPVEPPEVEYDAFIVVQSLLYSIRNPQLIRCTGFAKSYNHVKFEESILKNKTMLSNYLEMLGDILDEVYVKDRLPGQSAIIFCATVTMCTLLTNYLKKLYPELHVERYVSQDSYEECFLGPDVVVSTIGSAGTAVDKPNLRETIMTNALNSKQANIQVLGRTRRLRDFPDATPRFHFLSAREIAKHMEYARAKEPKFQGKVLGFRTLNTAYRI